MATSCVVSPFVGVRLVASGAGSVVGVVSFRGVPWVVVECPSRVVCFRAGRGLLGRSFLPSVSGLRSRVSRLVPPVLVGRSGGVGGVSLC